ncbi:MAG: hypothetical protein OEV42_12065 [Deltaproteobacteria bacterium]|nr:hypothetical protein [Deltaproteobacteria bacterium]
MGIIIKKNVLTVEGEDLDIYIADELKTALLDLYKKGKKKVSLDLVNVERITTPAAQVILSAKKTFSEVKIINAGGSISLDLKNIGVEL